MNKTIIGSSKDNRTVRVTDEGAFVMTFTSALPVDEDTLIIPFSTFLTINGIPLIDGGNADLTVDGSSQDVDAFITGQKEGDLYITSANIVIADSPSVSLNQFGGITELTTGIDFFYEIKSGRRNLAAPIKTNFGFIRLGSLTTGIGSKNDAYQINKINAAGDDGFNPILDLSLLSPLGIGMRVKKNSNDKIGISIRDNLSAVSTFDVLVTGYIRLIADIEE